MTIPRHLRVLVLLVTAAIFAAVASSALANSSPNGAGAGARQQSLDTYLNSTSGQPSATHTANDGDLADSMGQYDAERFAPGNDVPGPALLDARLQASALPTVGGSWTEDTTKPYNAEPANYTDPAWSNVGAGFSLVGGRVTTLDSIPVAGGTPIWLAGTADGGIWRSTDEGTNWTPVFDSMPTLSIGSIENAPDGSVWVGTGEANTSQDSYSGTGVYRSTDGGQTWSPVDNADGSDPLAGHTIFRLAFTGSYAFAATNNGLWRYDGSNWTEILDPAPANDPKPWYDNQVTDVVVDPADPSTVLTVVGWRGPLTPDSANGFYESTDGGKTFNSITPAGDINTSDIGRTTFAWSNDGTELYAVIESPSMLAAGDISNLQGVFVTSGTNGGLANPDGTWKQIADASTLSADGSANAYGPNSVGAQAWYNQTLAVDPNNAQHVYLGLEEVFESSDAGQHWDTASPYWNTQTLSCYPMCPNITHPDQHALMISDGKVVIGNDGGVYSRSLTDTGTDAWSDLNATMHNLQYYYAGAGYLPAGGVGIWGGLQDNGTALFDPNQSQMVEPAGGDGFDVIVNPANANDMVGEYTDLTMYASTDGGHTFNPYVSPGCVAQATVGLTPRKNCDPSARFVAPFAADQTNINDWVAGGRYIWTSTAGWNTTCGVKGCSWNRAFDTGANNAVTAVSEANGAIYATWVGGGGNPGPSFGAGIVTNVHGWHQVSMTGLPDRYPAGIVVDKTNRLHAIVVFNGYSRRWIPGGGTGHVFETFDGGKTWTDISGDLPDVPCDAVVLLGSQIVVATDSGVFTAAEGAGTATQWSTLGTGLPNASVNDIRVGPDGTSLYAATHGRGVWSITP